MVKKHHFHSKTVALHKIHCYQKLTELLIRKLPFQGLVFEIARLISVSNHPLHGSPRTNRGIPVLSLSEDTDLSTVYPTHVTIQPKDLALSHQLRESDYRFGWLCLLYRSI